ncbi:MAG: hypothetical protein U1A78_17870 [Polyangia bacterium]
MRPRITPLCLLACLVPSLAVGLAACTAPPTTDPDGVGAGPYLGSCQPWWPSKDLDILFVVDSSPGMATKQRAFVESLPAFVRALSERDVNFHIGVVTTDVGANPTATSGFPGGRTIPGCASFAGDDGRLQNLPCTARGLSSAALAACTQLCPDPRAVPSDGRRYISRVDSVLNVPSKRDAQGREIGAEEALKCMALVGDTGCRIEAPLEAAKRALDGHLADNTGFLRSNSTLAVFFVTDEDDCSVQIGRRSELDPQTQDCSADASPDAPATCFGLELRCLARGVECFDDSGTYQPMTRAGAKAHCQQRTSSFLVPLASYIRFFSVLRPSDKLILGGIVPPSLLGAQDGAGSGPLILEPGPSGPAGSAGLVPGGKARAACYDPAQPVPPEEADRGFSGQAQVRLSSLLRSFPGFTETSTCAVAGYPGALSRLAERLLTAVKPQGCLSGDYFLQGSDGLPVCQVGYVDRVGSAPRPVGSLPRCSATCCSGFKAAPSSEPSEPLLAAACAPEPQDCYCLEQRAACDGGPAGTIWRRGGAAPDPGQRACFSCLIDPSHGWW